MDEVSKGKLLEDVLAEKGLSMGFVYGDSGSGSDEIVDREIKLEATPRAQELMKLYYQSFASAYAHTTPSIYPRDLLPGGKT